MYVFFLKRLLVMAGVTGIRDIVYEEFRIFACMGIMAAGAAHADGGMNNFLIEHRFVVASVAKVGLLRGKTFRFFVQDFMGNVRSIDPGMA